MIRSERIAVLKKLIQRILAEKLDTSQVSLDEILKSYNPPRQEYENPNERSGNNYGYMTSSEIGAGNQEAP